MKVLAIPLALACLVQHEASRAGWQDRTAEILAQLFVESSFRPQARSPYAAGLAQFTPATWSDWSPRTEPSCAGADPTDAECSVRAQIAYMRWLLRRERGSWTLAWRGYNGGAGWIARERRAAIAAGLDPRDPEHLARLCETAGRSAANCRENTEYPHRIRRTMERL